MRIGSAFSDLGLEALLRDGKVGMTERELGALVEREYHALGGSTIIHFIGVNAMNRPDTCVPPQTSFLAKAAQRRHDVRRVQRETSGIRLVSSCARSAWVPNRRHCSTHFMKLQRPRFRPSQAYFAREFRRTRSFRRVK